MPKFIIPSSKEINKPGKDGYTPLSLAVVNGSLRQVMALLNTGASPNALTFSETPLFDAVRRSGTSFAAIIKALLERGTDLELKNSQGSTALIVAVKNGRLQNAKLLLQYGANPKAQDKQGKTAADYAPTEAFKKFLSSYKAAEVTSIKEAQTKLPKRLENFYKNNEAKKYQGKEVSKLPGYTAQTKLKVKFVKQGFELFEENGINQELNQKLAPLAKLVGEEQFLTVNIKNPKCPVSMWEHENGKFYPVAPSLDIFLKRLS